MRGCFVGCILKRWTRNRQPQRQDRETDWPCWGENPFRSEWNECAAGQLRREDVLRHLARIAFGRVNDAVELALRPETANPAQMDLSALSELKVTEKGVELKLVDRIRALETLFRLLEQGDNDGAEGLYQALEAVAGALGDEDGE